MKVVRIECDKCGKELDAVDGLSKGTRHAISITYWNLRKEAMEYQIDLCDAHFTEFKKFIKEGNGK